MVDISINKVVIHELVKEQHKSIQKSNLRETVLDESSDIVLKLVTGVALLYGRRNHRAHYGVFREDENRGIFPDSFEGYAPIEKPNDTEFLDITRVAMKALYGKAESTTPASGGYILFADYKEEEKRYFLTAMIKQKEGLRLSKDLDLEELISLDLSKLHQAARINFLKLASFLKAQEHEKMDLSYLSFISPLMGQAAAGYFVTALGCAPGTTPSQATDTLILESVKFFREKDDLKENRFDFKRDLLLYIKDCVDYDKSIKLSQVEQIARNYIPADDEDIANQIADDFIAFLNSEECSVPVEFPPNKRTFAKYTHIKSKADNWEFKFERQALGKKPTDEIYYDEDDNRVIINNIPEKTIEMIKQELSSRNN